MTEQTALYNDILITACEHAIHYWAHLKSYRSGMDRSTGEITKPGRAVIVDCYGDDDWKHTLTPATMRRGLRLLATGKCTHGGGPLPAELVSKYASLLHGLEKHGIDWTIDSDDADTITQAGVFGDIVYG